MVHKKLALRTTQWNPMNVKTVVKYKYNNLWRRAESRKNNNIFYVRFYVFVGIHVCLKSFISIRDWKRQTRKPSKSGKSGKRRSYVSLFSSNFFEFNLFKSLSCRVFAVMKIANREIVKLRERAWDFSS